MPQPPNTGYAHTTPTIMTFNRKGKQIEGALCTCMTMSLSTLPQSPMLKDKRSNSQIANQKYILQVLLIFQCSQ